MKCFKDCAAILLILIISNLVFLPLFHRYGGSLNENGIVENLQVLFLTLGMVWFLYDYFTCNLKGFAFISSAFCLGFILRELDVEDFDINPIFILLGSGVGRNVLLTLLLSYSIYLLVKNHKPGNLNKALMSHYGFCIILSAPFFVSSWIFDKNIFNVSEYLFLEEISELNAYFIIFISSIVFGRNFRVAT